MSETFQLGDVVVTPRARGTIIDITATVSGQWLYGVEGENGEVVSMTPKGITSQGSS